MTNENLKSICDEFARILQGKGKVENGTCKVSLKRQLNVTIQGKISQSILGVTVMFESIDQQGNALNLAEVPILESEIHAFEYAAIQQGLIISALHNHWIYTRPTLYYIHLQSVEPPILFAQKVAYALSQLHQYPKAKD